MTCTACVGRVESALETVEGVWPALENIGNSNMTVVFDKSRVTDEQLAYSMREVNYQVIRDNRVKTAKQELKALNVQRRDLLISMVFAVVLIVIAMGRVVGLEIPLDPLPFCLIQLVPCLSIMYGGKRFYKKDILTPFTKSLLVD